MTKVGTTDLRHDDENRQLIEIQIKNKHAQKRQTNNAKQHKQKQKEESNNAFNEKRDRREKMKPLHRDTKHLGKKWRVVVERGRCP